MAIITILIISIGVLVIAWLRDRRQRIHYERMYRCDEDELNSLRCYLRDEDFPSYGSPAARAIQAIETYHQVLSQGGKQ